MAIGRDVYLDTRLQLRKLESLFPSTSNPSTHNLTPKSTSDLALAHLFEIWSVEAGLFTRASQLIPSDMPLLKDPKFAKDREDFSGRKWSKEEIERNRPEALGVMRRAFGLVEGMLGDGRSWVLGGNKGEGEGGEGVSVADLDGEYSILFYVDWLCCVR